MKNLLIPVLLCFAVTLHSQIPVSWESRGVGGGGALFSPSINPTNYHEYYLACDMSELFHTCDFGGSYSQVSFDEFQASGNSKVWFTSTPGLLYCINSRTGLSQVAKSTDNGQSWQNVAGMMEWEEVYALWADYHHPGILITNFWNSILFSDDGGNSFATIHETSIGPGAHLAGVFFDLPDIFIGLNEGLLVSHDGGNSFAFESIPGIEEGQGFYSFAGAKQNDTTRLLTTTAPVDEFWNGMPPTEFWETIEKVYRLDYGFGAWVDVSATINWGVDYPMLVAMAENDIHTAFIGGSSQWEFPTVLKTTDGGNTWNHCFLTNNNQNIVTGWCGYQGDHHWWYPGAVLGIDVGRFNASHLIITDLGVVHKSDDMGQTWYQTYTASSDQHPAGFPTPKKQDYHSVGIENTSCWCMNWADEQNLFTGFSDISGLRSKDAGQTWSFDYTGHNQNTMYWMVQHPLNGNIYAATSTVHDLYQSHRLRDSEIEYEGSDGKIIFSEDGGENWDDLHLFGMPVYWVSIDPNNPERMFASVVNHSAGFGGIWKTENLSAGSSSIWSKIVNPTRTQGHPATIIVLNDGKVLTSWSARRNTTGSFTASSGVFLFDPATGSWQDLSHPYMQYWTKDLVADPFDELQNTWYACVFSGWGGPANDKGGLYRTFDRGQTWERIWITHRVESCSFNPLNPDELYVSTETDGLWHSYGIRVPAPVFERVENYNFMHPMRVFFNPFNLSEIWITSFGNGMKTGNWLTQNQQIVALPDGWSGISSFVQPENPVITNLFSPVMGSLDYLSGNDEIWWPAGGINTTTSWSCTSGYLVKMNNTEILTFHGTLPAEKKINILEGWNLIPVFADQPINCQELYTKYSDKIVIITEVAGISVFWPEMNVQTLNALQPGKSYFLYSNTGFEIDFSTSFNY